MPISARTNGKDDGLTVGGPLPLPVAAKESGVALHRPSLIFPFREHTLRNAAGPWRPAGSLGRTAFCQTTFLRIVPIRNNPEKTDRSKSVGGEELSTVFAKGATECSN